MKRKKVIIIGSGLGGLSAGVFLAKAGHDVTILEQSSHIGGCLQCFSRNGVKFETGMHFIGSADRGQALYRLMNALDIADKVQLSRLDTDSYDVVSLFGNHYKFANGRETFIRQMIEYFPTQKDNLEHYWDLIEAVANGSSLHTLQFNQVNMANNIEYQMRSMDSVIDSVITDERLAKVLVGNLQLYAGVRGKTPFSTHAFIMDFYNQSAYRIVGGSDTIAQALRTTLEKYDGRILLRKRVNSICCNDTQATCVTCDDRSDYKADVFISTVHPLRMLEMLGHTPLIRPAYRERLKNIDQTVGVFALYLHFKEGKMPYMNHNFYAYSQDTPWDCETYTQDTWPKGYLYMHFCQEPQPRYARAGVILSYMQMDDVLVWKGTKTGRRGAEYEAFKQYHAEKLFGELEKEFPGITDTVEDYYTSTPLTYLDYTGTESGSIYGMAKDVSKGAGGHVSYRTRIPNLLLAGQNINSHGMLGTLVGSVIACSEIIGEQQIYDFIGQSI